MGHVGLTPQSISALGGFRPQGRSSSEATRILREAHSLQAWHPILVHVWQMCRTVQRQPRCSARLWGCCWSQQQQQQQQQQQVYVQASLYTRG